MASKLCPAIFVRSRIDSWPNMPAATSNRSSPFADCCALKLSRGPRKRGSVHLYPSYFHPAAPPLLLLSPDHHLRLRGGMCLQQTDLGGDAVRQQQNKTFVVSLFGAKDDIKAHYTAERARVCGVTWTAFLDYAGASVEDVWGGVAEADRKLWSVRY